MDDEGAVRFTVDVPAGDEGPFRLSAQNLIDGKTFGAERDLAAGESDVRVVLELR